MGAQSWGHMHTAGTAHSFTLFLEVRRGWAGRRKREEKSISSVGLSSPEFFQDSAAKVTLTSLPRSRSGPLKCVYSFWLLSWIALIIMNFEWTFFFLSHLIIDFVRAKTGVLCSCILTQRHDKGIQYIFCWGSQWINKWSTQKYVQEWSLEVISSKGKMNKSWRSTWWKCYWKVYLKNI